MSERRAPMFGKVELYILLRALRVAGVSSLSIYAAPEMIERLTKKVEELMRAAK